MNSWVVSTSVLEMFQPSLATCYASFLCIAIAVVGATRVRTGRRPFPKHGPTVLCLFSVSLTTQFPVGFLPLLLYTALVAYSFALLTKPKPFPAYLPDALLAGVGTSALITYCDSQTRNINFLAPRFNPEMFLTIGVYASVVALVTLLCFSDTEPEKARKINSRPTVSTLLDLVRKRRSEPREQN